MFLLEMQDKHDGFDSGSTCYQYVWYLKGFELALRWNEVENETGDFELWFKEQKYLN